MYARQRDFNATCGFVLTDAGRNDLVDAEPCACEDLLLIDGTMQCRECGTVYGILYGFSRPPRRSSWRKQAPVAV